MDDKINHDEHIVNEKDIDADVIDDDFVDPLDKPGNIKLAKIHCSANQVYNIPDKYAADSKLLIIVNNIYRGGIL
jgi:hypothetical protein